MRTDGLFKILATGFLLALVLYLGAFKWIDYQREHKGPWIIEFTTDSNGVPSLTVSQAFLKIPPHRLTFPETTVTETNYQRSIKFDHAVSKVPFGELVFQDPLYLPGSAVFNFWGHEVQIIPRTLIVDRKEIPWNSTTNMTVTGEGKYQPPQPKAKKRGLFSQ